MAQYQIEMTGSVSLLECCDARDDDTALGPDFLIVLFW
jgi:hypothetical protein